MKIRWSAWVGLVPAVILLGMSLWVVWFHYPLEEFCRMNMPCSYLVVRQSVVGIIALLLAAVIGRFSLHRRFLKHWYIFPALFMFMFLAVPVSLWMGIDRVIMGTHWWQRSIGISAVHLALIGGLCFVLPRFAERWPDSSLFMAALFVFAVLTPLLFLNRMAECGIFYGVLLFVLPMVLRGRRLTFTWLPVLITLPVTLLFVLFCSATRMTRILAFLDPKRYAKDEAWQLIQSLTSVTAGGWAGCTDYPPFIPEWKTAFIFGKLCGAGGAVAGLAALLLTAVLAVWAWRIAFCQSGQSERVLGAACASILTLYPLGHLYVNLGLAPTQECLFPFLSYGRHFMLFCGFLLGLLISLGREEPGEVDADAPPRLRWAMPALWALLLFVCAVRLTGLVVNPPLSVQSVRQSQLRRIVEWQAEQKQWMRGWILDCKGNVLAQTGTNMILCADPCLLADSTETNLIPEVARLAGLDERYIRQRIVDPRRRYVRLRKYLLPEAAEEIRWMSTSGFFLDEEPTRSYPFEIPLAHLVGFVQLSEGGMTGTGGIEMIRQSVLDDGQDITLTLDIGLQTAVQQIAESAAEKTKAEQVQIVVMNPCSGAIRAAAQLPAVHGGHPMKGKTFALNWRAVVDVFEPGGLIKPLVMASALDRGVILTNSVIDCENGCWMYQGRPLHDPHGYEGLFPEEILVKSSNIGMAKVGLEMGEQPLYEALIKWKLKEPCSGGGFGGASPGILYSTNHWSKISVTRIPMGHECACSLLQIMRAYTAFFNEGKMSDPYLVISGTVPKSVSVIKPETARQVRDMLRKVVTEGTGKEAQIPEIEMPDGCRLSLLGKTAVTQKILPGGGGYSRDNFQTAFVGGFEMDDTPFLIAVWLDEPDRSESFNPAPEIFREVVMRLAETNE